MLHRKEKVFVMEIPNNRSHSLRRRSHPISSLERAEFGQSQDSGVYDGDNSNYGLENIELRSSSSESVVSSLNNTGSSQPQDESIQARKRVKHACDFCRRKKCKVFLHLIVPWLL